MASKRNRPKNLEQSTVDKRIFYGVLERSKQALEFAQSDPRPESSWAARQAFVTILTFMEHWAIHDGVEPAKILQFDLSSRKSAKEMLNQMSWVDRKTDKPSPYQ